MTALTSAQRDLLAKIAQADGGEIATASATTKALIRRGLLISIPRAEGGSRLQITNEGRASAGLAPAEAALAATPPRGKVGSIIELLRRPEGATIEALMDTTGWQAHSVRGAIAGAIKKGQGLAVISERTDAGRIYRIAEGAGA